VNCYYMATQKFDRTSVGWDAYAKWRNLPQLAEVVSMDSYCMLGGHRLTAKEWADIAPAAEVGTQVACFRTLECLRGCLIRIGPTVPFNLLCVFREPNEPPVSPQPSFALLGYDLIEDRTRISALTNCGGGFPAAFSDAEISELGLIRTYERAKEIQKELPRAYPHEPHANCSLWAIFRARLL